MSELLILNLVGDSDSRGVLDAFFLGKALAEALNERIESTVGELLSAVGRLQAEQQKQIQDFQVVGNSNCSGFSLDSFLVLSYFLRHFTFFLFNTSFIYSLNLVEDHIYADFYCRQVKRGTL